MKISTIDINYVNTDFYSVSLYQCLQLAAVKEIVKL